MSCLWCNRFPSSSSHKNHCFTYVEKLFFNYESHMQHVNEMVCPRMSSALVHCLPVCCFWAFHQKTSKTWIRGGETRHLLAGNMKILKVETGAKNIQRIQDVIFFNMIN